MEIGAIELTARQGGAGEAVSAAHEAIPPSPMSAPYPTTPAPHAPPMHSQVAHTLNAHTFESTHSSDIWAVTAGKGHTTLAAVGREQFAAVMVGGEP